MGRLSFDHSSLHDRATANLAGTADGALETAKDFANDFRNVAVKGLADIVRQADVEIRHSQLTEP